jgi:hypothetical protein
MTRANPHIALSILVLFGVHHLMSQSNKCLASNTSYPITRNVLDADEPLYIPVVFHVVFNNEEQNISFSQVQSQLDILNQDFNKTNPNWSTTADEFKELVADCKISFYLHSIDNVQKGIRRVATDHGPFVNSDIHYDEHGGSSAFTSESVLNIWVADLGGDVFGYSQSESTYPEAESGVVIDYEHIGTMGTAKPPYNGGRTLTHEIGHWLGLSHLWGDGGCENDDGIADTPDQEATIYQCDLTHFSCGSLDAVQNFMNLTPDACMTFFSSGQKAVMRQYLLEEKPDLIRSKPILGAGKYMKPVIYPNPTDRELYISSISAESDIEMWDLGGAKISLSIDEVKPNLLKVSPKFERVGSFIIRINDNGLVYSQKIILTN